MESAIILAVEIAGIIAFTISGAVVAIDKGLDVFGVALIGVLTALGGGVIRDIILGIFPPIMFTYKIYAVTSLISSLIVFIIAYVDRKRFFSSINIIDKVVNIFDAIGLGLFAVTSVQRCFQHGYGDNAFLCIFMAMTTCIGGGIMRDLLCQRLPAVLRKRIYALAAIAGGAVYYYMHKITFNSDLSMIFGASTAILIRLMATKFKWNMPRIERD
ncbi:hypothetical protein IMSAG049_00389 [Clostridiales bacterium]|nr:hypothetical protein IMSAG049_00389 [Clostridiales bacterium]